jgi:hypothetical protein
LAACAYLGLAIVAHRVALDRVKHFAVLEHLDVQGMGALPLPPSIWRWDGLVRVPRGVYEMPLDLGNSGSATRESLSDGSVPPIEYRFYPDTFPNADIEAARQLPEVQKVLWFDRFPVTRFRLEGSEVVVEFLDMRFPQIRADRPRSFTYEVRFDHSGKLMSQGWAGR